jgi:hypothetical protein
LEIEVVFEDRKMIPEALFVKGVDGFEEVG